MLHNQTFDISFLYFTKLKWTCLRQTRFLLCLDSIVVNNRISSISIWFYDFCPLELTFQFDSIAKVCCGHETSFKCCSGCCGKRIYCASRQMCQANGSKIQLSPGRFHIPAGFPQDRASKEGKKSNGRENITVSSQTAVCGPRLHFFRVEFKRREWDTEGKERRPKPRSTWDFPNISYMKWSFRARP